MPFMLSYALILCLKWYVYPQDNRILSFCMPEIANITRIFIVQNQSRVVRRTVSLPTNSSEQKTLDTPVSGKQQTLGTPVSGEQQTLDTPVSGVQCGGAIALHRQSLPHLSRPRTLEWA